MLQYILTTKPTTTPSVWQESLLIHIDHSFMPVGIISLLPSTSWLVNRVCVYIYVYTPPTPPPSSALPMVVTELWLSSSTAKYVHPAHLKIDERSDGRWPRLYMVYVAVGVLCHFLQQVRDGWGSVGRIKRNWLGSDFETSTSLEDCLGRKTHKWCVSLLQCSLTVGIDVQQGLPVSVMRSFSELQVQCTVRPLIYLYLSRCILV